MSSIASCCSCAEKEEEEKIFQIFSNVLLHLSLLLLFFWGQERDPQVLHLKGLEKRVLCLHAKDKIRFAVVLEVALAFIIGLSGQLNK